MRDFSHEGLSHDPIHGYISFTAGTAAKGEHSEQDLIDHPWVQRLRQIHQLQTAWYVFPGAEHTRFQHVLGVMHLASRAAATLYDSLAEVCTDVPSRAYVESLLRIAGLLHDVGHGPFGHFFDDHYLADFGLTHETLGCAIIRGELAPLIRGIRANPQGRLRDDEHLDPEHVALLITRPRPGSSTAAEPPRWLAMLRSLFCGIYTVDNMDFVLRDAYMSGYTLRAFDLERLLHYSFFSEQGLTIHSRGLPELVRFVGVRADLFRSLYFHRTVRSLDLTLEELFRTSRKYIFPGNPLEHLDAYRELTEWSLLVDVARWPTSEDAQKREAGEAWLRFVLRQVRWKMACERTVFFRPEVAEASSIFSRVEFFGAALRERLPQPLRELPLRFDLARHVHRPGTRGPVKGQNFLFDPASGDVRSLDDSELVRQLPMSFVICRVYAETREHDRQLAEAMSALVDQGGAEVRTNM